MTGTHYLGICDECRRIENFSSADERDWWEQNHQLHPDQDGDEGI